MKIDTFSVNMSSAHELYKNTKIVIEEETRFVDLLGLNLGKFDRSRLNFSQFNLSEIAAGSSWYDVFSTDGEDTIELSAQFMGELKKLREIMEVICRRLNSLGLNGCTIQPSAVNRLDIGSGTGMDGPGVTQSVMEYEYLRKTSYSYYEKEATGFFADGMLKTADGRTIDLSFQLNLAREYFNTSQFVHREKGYVLIDPLVINFDRDAPQLSEAHMSFDLNLDGETEDILMPGAGSGFLAFDKNKDGIINDGSELFGPSTGSGFGELVEYDLDKNQWIDENDAIYDELVVWENDPYGQIQLTSLKEADIGAICLVSQNTPFDFRDEKNQLQAKVQRSGIAMHEDGRPMLVQEVDWAV